jgi:hypothetical protein
MIMSYAIMKSTKTPGVEDAPIVMAYLYLGHVIPAKVHGKLNDSIERLLVAIDSDEEIFSFFFMDAATRRQVSRVLKQWQQPMTGVCSPRLVRRRNSKEAEQREDAAYHVVWRGKGVTDPTTASQLKGRPGRSSLLCFRQWDLPNAEIQPPFH